MREPLAQQWFGFLAGVATVPILVLLFGRIMTGLYGGVSANPEYAAAVAATRDIAEAIDRYQSRYYRVPEPDEGLALLVPEFLVRLPPDPWGHPYVYDASDASFADVLSYGADGKPGGSRTASDISGRYGQKFVERPPPLVPFVASLILYSVPLLALLAARRWQWGVGLLAGMGTFWAVLLVTTITSDLRISTAGLFGLLVALSCMAGSVAVLRGLRGARILTCTAVLFAYFLFDRLFTI
jgi:general secretion pathway protein G